MCLTLQRLRTLETGCGYRVRSFPNLSGVYKIRQSCPRPRFHGSAGTPRRTRQSWRSAARINLSPAELFPGMNSSVKQKRKLFLGRLPTAAAWFHLRGTLIGVSQSRVPGLVKEQIPHSLSPDIEPFKGFSTHELVLQRIKRVTTIGSI